MKKKRTLVSLFLASLLCFCSKVNADIYLQNPRGSNNRLSEASRERANENRMFDSQNNERGGYNVARPMSYYAGSLLQVEWTNQHSCMSANANCDLILQYMCDDSIRDGLTTNTIKENNKDCNAQSCNTDLSYGMNENLEYYEACKRRARNSGLFVADQRLRGNTAIYTRQNPNGERFAYECPEERDYYPYWSPTKWVDIAILTNNVSQCEFYRAESENVKSRFYCSVPAGYDKQPVPISADLCQKIPSAVWTESPGHGLPAPICRESQKTRDNHLGDSYSGNSASFTWKLPMTPAARCVFRVRYNITTGDYDSDQSSATKVDIGKKLSLSTEAAAQRGYLFKNNPVVRIFPDLANISLQLAINTAQFGRVFQDRSHTFGILAHSHDDPASSSSRILNLNVRGKRGNIVQVYPAVEYDFVPSRLELATNDLLHIQWTGSDTNPVNNDGQGAAGTDRSNIVPLKFSPFAAPSSNDFYNPLSTFGSFGANIPLNLSAAKFLDFPKPVLASLATLNAIGVVNASGGNDQLNDKLAYFDLGLQKVTSSAAGVYYYMCTRNNNFSNRDQKGQIVCYDHPWAEDFIGQTGGNVQFNNVQVTVPSNAFKGLVNVRVDSKDVSSMKRARSSKSFGDSLDLSKLGSGFVNINVNALNGPDSSATLQKPLSVKLTMTRSAGFMETQHVYRLNSDYSLASKVQSSPGETDRVVVFRTSETKGTYVVQFEKDYSALIVCAIVAGLLLIAVSATVTYLVKNPKYVSRLRYTKFNLKRSIDNEL